MKRQYITPSILVVKLDMRSSLMNLSINDKEISSEYSEDVGFARESTITGKNTWDEEW